MAQPPNQPNLPPQDAWNRLVGAFRRLCLLRREGRAQESARAIQEELPRRIADWSRVCPMDAARKRAELEAMMREEQRRVDDAWMVQQLVVQRVAEEVVPVLIEAIGQEVQAALSGPAALRRSRPVWAPERAEVAVPRVRFDDVQGMIDSVLDQEARRAPALHPA